MVQKIHPRGVIRVLSNSPHDVHLNWNSGARSLSSSKACPWLVDTGHISLYDAIQSLKHSFLKVEDFDTTNDHFNAVYKI